jgi:hypothetical protein
MANTTTGYHEFPTKIIFSGTRDTMTQAMWAKWTFTEPGSGRSFTDSVNFHFWDVNDASQKNATAFSGKTIYLNPRYKTNPADSMVPFDLDSVVGFGDWSMVLTLTDVNFTNIKTDNALNPLRYTYHRRAPILHSVSLPTSPDTTSADWSFGTPRYLTLDWTPSVNTGANAGNC